jgi:ubiquitin-like protein ATG12
MTRYDLDSSMPEHQTTLCTEESKEEQERQDQQQKEEVEAHAPLSQEAINKDEQPQQQQQQPNDNDKDDNGTLVLPPPPEPVVLVQNQEQDTSTTPSSPVVRRQQPFHSKVKIHLIAVGSAPILKKSKFSLASNVTFGNLHKRLKKMLNLNHDGDLLYLYVQQSFIPSVDDWLGDLSDLYSIRDELQIHYSLKEAWG